VRHLALCQISALEPFLNLLREEGIPARRHLAAAQIPDGFVDQPGTFIAKLQLYQFLNSIARHEGIPDLGIRGGKSLRVDQLGEAGASIYRAPTLLDACRNFAGFIDRFVDGNDVWVETDSPDRAWLLNRVTDDLGPGRDIADHGGVMMLTGVIRLAAGPDWYPRAIRLQTEPAPDAFASTPFAEARIEYNCPATGVAFESRLLHGPLGTRGDSSIDESGGISTPALPDSFGAMLEILLVPHVLLGQIPSLETAAEIIGTSPRTLRRRLADEGIGYRQVTDRVRFRRARELLADSGLSITEIAYGLGYSGPNNFTRAFRRMSTFTPGEYRRTGELDLTQDR
jgi:AraC-like DNA-binding protein